MIPAGLAVIQVIPTPDTVTIVASSTASTAACPSCGHPSRRVHSTYQRQLQDPPWQGRAVVIQVCARRFRCPDLACARRTCRLGDLQRHIGLAAGGEAGARLARRLAMPVSPDKLLRLVLRNLGAALRHVVERHHVALRRAGREVAAELAAERAADASIARPEPVPTARELRQAEGRALARRALGLLGGVRLV